MSRVFNFSAGPAMIPEEVLERAQSEMLEWQGSGMSVMEMSHRGKDFMGIAEHAEKTLREIMEIPSNYKVLFLQGGASSQFAAAPMNLLRGKNKADYLLTGMWGKKAIAEAKKYCEVNVACSSAEQGFNEIPAPDTWTLDADAAYVHYTPNETIGGVEYHWMPDTGDIPLVADMSSTILSRQIPVERFGMIYAGAQKNVGCAGLTIVIVRDDLIGDVIEGTPSMMNYQTMVDADSMYNTPPTYSWYIAGLVFDWIKEKGGVKAMGEINQRKANKLYDTIDQSDYYTNPVRQDCRSWMNVPFILGNDDHNEAFLSEAKDAGLVTLKGHRSVGGMRASIYNAMPEAGVDALVSFMTDFESRQS
jgi:phosphoserine aminotransferase